MKSFPQSWIEFYDLPDNSPAWDHHNGIPAWLDPDAVRTLTVPAEVADRLIPARAIGKVAYIIARDHRAITLCARLDTCGILITVEL